MRPHKRDYSDDERKKILNYIIDNEGFYNLRGNTLWKEMEKQKVVKRTWQSMKEHFRMKIINNLKHFNISKENEGKILSGYNNTKTVEKTDNQKAHVPKYVDIGGDNISFSDEERIAGSRRRLSTSSDDSDNLVIEVNHDKPSTSKKGFKKQIFKRKSKINIISDSEESVSKDDTQPIIEEIKKSKNKKSESNHKKVSENCAKQLNSGEDNDTIDIVVTSPSIPDENPDDPPSCNVSSTNLDEGCVEFSIVDDKKFLQAITKYDSNLVSCSSIVTFIKQYTDYNQLCQDWKELYDRFVDILNYLQLYDFLAPETVTKLQNIKEPLEKYRLDGFQESQIEILPITINNETLKFTLAPDPELIYLKQKQLDLVTLLQKNRSKKCDIIEEFITGEISQQTVSDIIKKFAEFKEKFTPQTSIDNNRNDDVILNVTQSYNADLNEDCLEIRIKEEDLSLNIEDTISKDSPATAMLEADNQSNISDSIPLQPQIYLDSSRSVNGVQNSQYLESLTTEELHVTNILGNIIEDDINESDLDFLTCESQV